jgi:hypothetical protein
VASPEADPIQEVNAAPTEMSTRLELLIERVAEQDNAIQRSTQREAELTVKSAVADAHISRLQTEMATLREQLRRALDRLDASEAKNAVLEERSRHQERTIDRAIATGRVVLISLVSATIGALLVLLM